MNEILESNQNKIKIIWKSSFGLIICFVGGIISLFACQAVGPSEYTPGLYSPIYLSGTIFTIVGNIIGLSIGIMKRGVIPKSK